ncbi:MAG TPA: hypothetical protein HA263_04960 [Methanoregulaceae archaeon]|nr:hypothetical protein [Methanoregulaceae archaeon]
MSAPDTRRPTPARSGLPVDEEEMRRWMRRLVALGYQESTARNWVSRIRIACAHGVTDEAEVDAGFPSYTSESRSVMRAAIRMLDEFRRSG